MLSIIQHIRGNRKVPQIVSPPPKSKVRMKTIHRKKNQRRGDQIGYPTYIDPHISFTPSFGFALPEPPLLLIVLMNQFHYFPGTLKVGVKQGVTGSN